jgi:hypothetical protein
VFADAVIENAAATFLKGQNIDARREVVTHFVEVDTGYAR